MAPYPRIEDHALISDCHSAALVDRTGSINWWCAPAFDSPAVFARILDPEAGHFSIRPHSVTSAARHYRPDSLVLVTTFRTPEGELELCDALAMAEGVRGHQLGVDSPHVILRTATCTAGTVAIDVAFAPRMEYGLTYPIVERDEHGVVARGGATQVRLSTSLRLEVEESIASGTVRLAAGTTAAFAVEHRPSWQPPPEAWSTDAIASRLDDTTTAWRSWSDQHQRYSGPFAHRVNLSGRVLHGLTYRPTGAIVAAPTTSLPESVGGERNWDYRYAWVRDASFTLDALWVAACPDEAQAFLSYLTTAASSIHRGDGLQIMFGIRGERDLTERTLPWLSGWRGSRPVRVGNGAWRQTQLDVYGELLAAVHRIRSEVFPVAEAERRLLLTLVERAASKWREKDQGIWEVRGEPQHFLHSKLMCWVALDRAIDLADDLRASEEDVARWRQKRSEIRTAIEDQGWSESAAAFTQAFGSDVLDASALTISLVGFLPGDDPRVLATIDAIETRLTDEHGLVYRYLAPDGLEGDEGTFLLCTFWLAEALALAGRTDRARQLFETAASYSNDLGLLAEEVDPESGGLLGNFPQAFSHIGLINAAWAIGQAEQEKEEAAAEG